jgi:LPS export ABC transporter protein LptC
MNARQLQIWAALLATAAAITWWLARDEPLPAQRQASTTETPPGFYVREARLTGLGEDGQVLYRLDAVFGSQAELGGPITMQEVTIDYLPAAEVPWRIEGRQAEIAADHSEIRLFDGVTAWSTGNAAPPATIRTDSMHLDPHAQFASTRDRVAIQTPEGTLSGVGMKADLRTDRLTLEADVHGTFTP